MRLHTDGNTIVLLSPKGRLTWRKSGKVTSEALPPNSEISDYDRNGMLCMTPKGDRDFSARLTAAGALAADAIDEETVAAVILGQDGTYLVRGPVSLDADWPSVIDLSNIEAQRIEWPAGVIWKKGDKSMYEMADANGGGVPSGFVPTLECNQFGTAIASVGNGAIVVVRPNSRVPDFCFQLPSQEEAAIYACPTEAGVLVTVIVDGQDTAYLHIAEDGKVLGKREAQSGVPALALKAGFLIYDDASSKIELLDPTLKTLTSIDMPWRALDSASADDGASFALADADHILRGHVNAKGELVIVATCEYGDHAGSKLPGEIAAAEAKWDPERCHGKSAVGFAAGITQAAWTAKAGEEFELELYARSTGGKGEGISITIGGDAMKHCEFDSIEVAGVRTKVERDDKGSYTAEFPDVVLVQGLTFPLNPKPKNDVQKHAASIFLADTHIELRLYGVATSPSSDLMSVSISALRSDSPPLKWMRPLTLA